MPSMTTCSIGEVVLVAFPFTNLKATKKRPAVVISSYAYQQERPDIIVMAITSQIRTPLTVGEYLLQDWQAANLPKASLLKPLIATLDQQQIIRTIGQLSVRDLNGLHQSLQSIIG